MCYFIILGDNKKKDHSIPGNSGEQDDDYDDYEDDDEDDDAYEDEDEDDDIVDEEEEDDENDDFVEDSFAMDCNGSDDGDDSITKQNVEASVMDL